MDSEKISALISLANRAHAETTRYRDHVWKILIWTVLLLAATLTAARTGRELLDVACWKWPLCLFAVFVAVSGIWNITFDYREFVRNRNWQRKCERILKFFEVGAYLEKESLLPEVWGKADYRFRNCLPHYLLWLAFIFFITLYAIFSIALIKHA
jgi:hypothetical protein